MLKSISCAPSSNISMARLWFRIIVASLRSFPSAKTPLSNRFRVSMSEYVLPSSRLEAQDSSISNRLTVSGWYVLPTGADSLISPIRCRSLLILPGR